MKLKKLIGVGGYPHARQIGYPIIFLKPIKKEVGALYERPCVGRSEN
jgi:hypothetical protein